MFAVLLDWVLWPGALAELLATMVLPATQDRIRALIDRRRSIQDGLEEAERLLILKTLEATSNNKTRAAEILGISLKTLHNKLKEYGSAGVAADVAQ